MFLIRFAKLTGYIPMRLFAWIRVIGREKLPKEPCILVANHGSMLDPVLLQIIFPMKHISFLCAEKLFHCPRICQAFLRKMGAVPIIDGTSELAELRRRAETADSKSMIGFFSQGRISQTRSAFMPGAAMLALETGLPLVPVFMHSAPFYKGGSRIRIGEPIAVEKTDGIDRESIGELTERVRNAVYGLSVMSK